MALAADTGDSTQPNDPRAVAMAVIGLLTFNVVVGSIFGTPGILLKPMMGHLNASMEQVSAGSLMVIVASAFFAPYIGSLATRHSLRLLLASAAILLSGAWLILAFTSSYAAYLIAYFLFLGPAMSIGASIVPPTLVTRWFGRNRGLAIGLVHLPIVVAAMPLGAAWLIDHYGLQTTFLMLAALPLVILLPAAFFLIDRPPGQEQMVAEMKAGGERVALTIPQLLAQPRYWAFCLAAGVVNTGSTLLGVHIVAMAESWGIPHMSAAGLASIMSGVGMFGSIIFGIVADRVGGALALVAIAIGEALLWSLFLAGLPYAGLAAIIGLIGLFGAGAVPAMGKGLADSFGRESFSRAIGLMVPVTLPLLIVGLIGPGTVVRLTGGYTAVVIGMVAAFIVAAFLAFVASRRSGAVASVTPA